jgi:probable HAF family extracellular repeat protein
VLVRLGINSKGVIVGQSCSASGMHPVRFREPGVIDDLGTFGGGWGLAQAINDAGVIVGSASYASGAYHGFMYADGKLNDAGSLPGMTYSQLLAVNGSSVAVGTSFDGPQRAVIYGAGRMIDLNTLVDGTPYSLTIANGIDEAGNIVAQGWDRGYSRVLLLRPR